MLDTKIIFNSTNAFSQATTDAAAPNNKEKYADPREGETPTENYNCHTAALNGSKGQAFQNKGVMSEEDRNADIKNNYDNVTSQEAVFGETVITFGDIHTVNYFGTSQDGTVYVFSKQGPNVAPEVTPVTNLVGGQSGDNDGNANYGFVGNTPNTGGKPQYQGSGEAAKTGQQKGAGGSGFLSSYTKS